MLCTMTKTPQNAPPNPQERPESGKGHLPDGGSFALPASVAGSGVLDRLVETAQDYARAAVSENKLKAYAKDWAHFARRVPKAPGAAAALFAPVERSLYR